MLSAVFFCGAVVVDNLALRHAGQELLRTTRGEPDFEALFCACEGITPDPREKKFTLCLPKKSNMFQIFGTGILRDPRLGRHLDDICHGKAPNHRTYVQFLSVRIFDFVLKL